MAQNDTIKIGPYSYLVLERLGNYALLSWIETTGIERELWIKIRR